MSELRDVSVDATEVLGPHVAEPLLDQVQAGADPRALLLQVVQLGSRGEPDPLVRAAIAALGRPRAHVRSVAADQAHMTAEVTRLAGVSPVRFLKDRARTAA
jgi:hypothetical protein